MQDWQQPIGAVASAIRTELERLGRWSATPIDPARLVDMGPFGANTLAAEEWIQFVLVPRLVDLAQRGGELPRESHVATWATRQFDGDGDSDALIDRLRDLDELIEREAAR